MNRRPLTAPSQPGRDVDNHPVGRPAVNPSLCDNTRAFPRRTNDRKTEYRVRRQTTRFREESLFYFFLDSFAKQKKSHGNACGITNAREARFVSLPIRTRVFLFLNSKSKHFAPFVYPYSVRTNRVSDVFRDDKRRENFVFSDVSK